MTTSDGRSRKDRWLHAAIVALLVGSISVVMVALFSWQISLGSQFQLMVGQVAPFDVVAPRQITYESQILTERAQDRASQAVLDQFDSAEGRVRRQQVSRSRDMLDFITIVRNDSHADPELQTDYLLAIPDLSLSPEAVLGILSVGPEQWNAVVQETPLALDRVMREEVRESALSTLRRRVPAMINSDLDEETTAVTAELVRALIRPNMLFNQERTEEMRNRARSDVPVQYNTLERNEIILRAGDIAADDDVEALTQVGLIQAEWSWWTVARAALFVLAMMIVAGGILYRLRPRIAQNHQELALVIVACAIWLFVAKFMIIPHDWLPYLFPLAALSMLLAVLIDLQVSVVVTILFMWATLYLSNNNVALVAYVGVGSLVGAFVLGRAERLTAFLWAGVAVSLSNLLVFAAFRAPFSEFATSKLLQMLMVVLINGGLSASIALIGYYVMGNLFGIITSLQLTELSRPTHPLLRQLLLKASGTYHHTIVVSNLAERATAAIGADAFLTRVGAYYHDIGKTVRPYFFAENIMDGASPHDKLDPLISAQIIISHVTEGINLAQKYHLPERIQDFIREHHGRSLVKYFYIQAQRQAGEGHLIDEASFRYPGPSPRSKETAILLLADTCEAAVRAIRPATRAELEVLVNRLIDEHVANGELNECNLTFKELQTTKDVFLRVLQGVHHPRVKYPEPLRPDELGISTPSSIATSAPSRGESQREGTPESLPGGVEEQIEAAPN